MTEVRVREPEIALVQSPEPWVDELHRYCTDHGGARVRCIVVDPGVAIDEEFDVLVTSDTWPALTRPLVATLHARGRRVLAVGSRLAACDPDERLAVDRVVDAGSTPVEIVDAVVAIAPTDRRPGPISAPGATAHDAGSAVPGPLDLVAVGGPFGAGSTEIAIALGVASARGGARPVIVDADDLTPSLAVRLGLPLEPNLCTAVDAVAFGLGAVPGALFDLGDGWPAVLVGAPSRAAAAALRSRDVATVGVVLAERFSPLVVDVSAGAPGPDGRRVLAPAVLDRARAVVAVGAANPVGVVRLLEWVRDLALPATGVPLHVVLNRAPAERRRRAELAGELQRELRVAGVVFVPTDRRVDDAAWGASIVERGPFARAIDALHRELRGARTAREH